MLTKLIGPRYVQIAKSWAPTLAGWGSVGTVTLLFATDWQVIMGYVPYINGKFKKDE